MFLVFKNQRQVASHSTGKAPEGGEEDELEAAEHLRGDDVEIQRDFSNAAAVAEVHVLEAGEDERLDDIHGGRDEQVALEGFVLVHRGAEIHEVIPEEKDRHTDGVAHRGDGDIGEMGVVVEVFERGGDEEVIHDRAGERPEDADPEHVFLARGGGVEGWG